MSSWIIAKSIHKKAVKEITSYHLTTPRRSSVEAKLTSTEEPFSVAQLYLNFIAAAIHMKKLNETCNVWDTTGILRLSIKSNPLINILKQEPSIESCSLDTYKPSISGMKFTELQKHFFSIFEYNDKFNSLIDRILQTVEIRGVFDLCIHIDSKNPLKDYVAMIKEYEIKLNKQTMSIYVMSDSYETVVKFKDLVPSSWKIISLNKFEQITDTDKFVQTMAEVKLMSNSSGMILDFSKPIDRLIYLLHRPKEDAYFKEVNKVSWYLLDE